MPPSVIPHTIHFIWLGCNLPMKYSTNLIKWWLENPQYTFYVWTEFSRMETLCEDISDHIFSDSQFKDALVTEHTDGPLILAKTLFDRYRLQVMPISILPALGDSFYLGEELSAWKNYGAASDILRLWALHEHGGIYMDFDTYSIGKPLPLSIRAPHGILFGRFFPFNLVNAVIATAKGNSQLLEITELIGEGYDAEYEKEYNDARKNSDFSQRLLTNVTTLREHLTSDDVKVALDAKQTIRASMGTLTIARSGPDLINYWLREKCNVTHRDPAYTEYSFQDQANYPLTIESHGSWLK